ncbi:DUF2971 domain-containing protein [Methanobrevibacter ruminantium]|uniref:DUF2971 domain-containing protein n=1 Tax=Methanobrevibacter ruminantium TaxID=83816 RepID=UPI0026EAD23D|nr:DUF2971 domain-containing protein [Methanobrevibacter ruminantium]
MWIDEFFELLYSKDTEKIGKAYELKNKKMPNFLYKYKSIDEKGHTFDLLENDLIYLSNANNLNDLYEGEFFYDDQEIYKNFESEIISNFIEKAKLNDKEKERLSNSKEPYLELHKLIYETDPIVNTDIPFEEFHNISLKIQLDTLNKVFQDGNNISKENTYLTCFSENHDLILMWSHYADSNQGICIKYNIKDYEYFIIRACYPIKYENGYCYTEELSDIKENMFKLMYDPYLRKETEWSHEKEWRILFNYQILLRSAIKIGEDYFLKLPKPSAIFLGKRISSENKQKIIDICKKREISLYQMEKDNQEAKLHDSEILKYSEEYWEDKSFIVESIKNKTCKSLIRDYFYYSKTIGDLEKGLLRIIDSFKDLTDEEVQFFLDELLFKKEIFPVLYPYYHNVLLFLIKLYDNASFNNISTADGISIEKNLETWIGYCFSSFYDKKIVRYLIFYERLFIRFYNRYVILSDEEKERYEQELSNYNLKNKYVTLIEDGMFDEFKSMHPFTTENQTELIRNNVLDNIQTVIDLFYINGNFDEDACYEEYVKLKSIVEKIEKNTELQYQEIFSNSERYLPIIYSCLFNESCDIQLQGSGGTLARNKHILKLVSQKDKGLFEVLGKINYNHRISSFISECCDELNINYKQSILINVDEEYFNPKNNPYTIFD